MFRRAADIGIRVGACALLLGIEGWQLAKEIGRMWRKRG